MEAADFIGLSKKGAQNLAEVNNMIFRLVSVDERNILGLPEDERLDRVCVEIEKGKVTRATIQ